MSYALDNLRLLIAHESQDEAEQLMNSLRNAGRATRAQLALGEDDLLRALKGGAWELIPVSYTHLTLPTTPYV